MAAGACGSRPRNIRGGRHGRGLSVSADGRKRFVAETSQGVMTAAGELAGDRQAGAVGAKPCANLLVVVVVRGRAPSSTLPSLKESPAEKWWALSSEVPTRALAV